jgi:ATP-binding cassette subfamily B protein
MVAVVEKAADFKGTLRRLLLMLRRDWWRIGLAVVFSIASIACFIMAPKTMEKATNELQEYVQLKMIYPQVQDLHTGLSDARETLADKRAEADDKLAEADDKMADGAKELKKAQKKIDDARAELRDARRKLADGQAKLNRESAKAKKKLAAAEKKAKAGFRKADKTLAAKKAQLEAGKAYMPPEQYAAASAQLASATKQLATKKAAALKKIAAGKKQLASALSKGRAQLASARAKLAKAERKLDKGQKKLDEKTVEFKQAGYKLAAAKGKVSGMFADATETLDRIDADIAAIRASDDDDTRIAALKSLINEYQASDDESSTAESDLSFGDFGDDSADKASDEASETTATVAVDTNRDEFDRVKDASDQQLLIFAKALALTDEPVLDYNYIGMIALVLIGLYFLYALFAYVQQRLTVTMTQELVRRLRTQVSEKLDTLPLKYFDGQTHGEILSKITIDIDLISTNLQQVLSQTLSSVFQLLGILIMMFSISWVLALVSCVAIPLTLVLTGIIAPKAQKFFARQQAQLGELNGQIEENYGGHNIIKAFNREEISLTRFRATNKQLYGSAWKAQFISSVLMPVINAVTNLQYVVIVVIAAILTRPDVTLAGINIGGMTVGAIFAFIQYVSSFQQPMVQMAQIANVIQGSIAAAERVFILLDEAEEAPDPDPAATVDVAQGSVTIDHIDFDYDPASPLIRDWYLDVKPGQMIAIVGPTGAGKTTIVNLLMRFYDVTQGSIRIDGVDTAAMKRSDVRALFGMVLQDTWLFNGSIADNIAFGRDDATPEQIHAAADTALADHFIRTLPHGYDTVLAEDAGNISVGQRQLLTIARAVLADSPILILDEATSSVDTRTEQLIQTAMARLMQGRTSFVIAHRLSTIRDADLIVAMNHGRIVESGSHDELLAADGFYAELYNSQFAGDEDA